MKLSTIAKIFVFALVLSACGGDDPVLVNATVSLSAPSTQVLEGDVVTITLTASEIVNRDVSIPLRYTGTATNGSDYQGSTRVVITAGTSSANLGLLIQQDEIDETDETIIIGFPDLGIPDGITIADQSSLTITIAGGN